MGDLGVDHVSAHLAGAFGGLGGTAAAPAAAADFFCPKGNSPKCFFHA